MPWWERFRRSGSSVGRKPAEWTTEPTGYSPSERELLAALQAPQDKTGYLPPGELRRMAAALDRAAAEVGRAQVVARLEEWSEWDHWVHAKRPILWPQYTPRVQVLRLVTLGRWPEAKPLAQRLFETELKPLAYRAPAKPSADVERWVERLEREARTTGRRALSARHAPQDRSLFEELYEDPDPELLASDPSLCLQVGLRLRWPEWFATGGPCARLEHGLYVLAADAAAAINDAERGEPPYPHADSE